MKAAVVPTLGAPLEIREVPVTHARRGSHAATAATAWTAGRPTAPARPTWDTMDGSYAEYAVAWASHVVLVPDEVAPIDASPLTCAGVTTYKALKAAPSQPGDTAMVVGVGGPGHLGPQCPVIRRDARVDLLLRWSDTAG